LIVLILTGCLAQTIKSTIADHSVGLYIIGLSCQMFSITRDLEEETLLIKEDPYGIGQLVRQQLIQTRNFIRELQRIKLQVEHEEGESQLHPELRKWLDILNEYSLEEDLPANLCLAQ
jgi:hypothetical protein